MFPPDEMGILSPGNFCEKDNLRPFTWDPSRRWWFKPKISLDYYNVFSFLRKEENEGLKSILGNLRIGASVKFTIFDISAHYYNHVFALGGGVDLKVCRLYLEGLFTGDFSDFGLSLLVKVAL